MLSISSIIAGVNFDHLVEVVSAFSIVRFVGRYCKVSCEV